MAVDLNQLLDPKRAEREEGWHNFAQSYERSMLALTEAIDKLTGKRKLDEGESAFTVLERYIEEQRNKAEMDREKAARLHDMVAASIPEVTAEQKAAYEAQKKLYDGYQDELKKQTKAIEDSAKVQTKAIEANAKAQIAAINKEEQKKLALIDAQAAQLKRQRGGDITKELGGLLDSGENASKSGGQDTLVSLLFAGAKDFLGKKQSEREALIDEAAELQREGIRSEYEGRRSAIEEEKAARLEAIKEESAARIQEIEKEVKAQAKLAGVEKAPEDPEKAREAFIDSTSKGLEGNKKLLRTAAASTPVAAQQREAMQKELQLEAVEEQAGEYLAPVVEEDALPGVAAPAPGKSEIPIAESTKPSAPKASVSKSLLSSAEGAGAVAKGTAGAASGSLASIATGVGAIAPAVAGVALPLMLGVRMLKDINDALPLVTSALGALGEGSKLLGPMILSAAWEIGGYMAEGVAKIVEVIERFKWSDTRKEKLEKSGMIDKERQRANEREAADQRALDQAVSTPVSMQYGGAEGRLQRVEPVYTTPTDERRILQPTPTASSAADLQQAITAMADAQAQAARRQAELGQGAVPLQLSTPALESFNM